MEHFVDVSPRQEYIDRRAMMAAPSKEAFLARRQQQLRESTTVYIGNLSYFTTETQIEAHFESCGIIKDIIMGLNTLTKTPAGHCFVEFYDQDAAMFAVSALNKSRLDDRTIRVEWDVGNVRETQRFWSRGKTGGQVRDEYRQDVDPGRGGFGVRRAVETGVERATVADDMVVYTWVAPPPQKKAGPPPRVAPRNRTNFPPAGKTGKGIKRDRD